MKPILKIGLDKSAEVESGLVFTKHSVQVGLSLLKEIHFVPGQISGTQLI